MFGASRFTEGPAMLRFPPGYEACENYACNARRVEMCFGAGESHNRIGFCAAEIRGDAEAVRHVGWRERG